MASPEHIASLARAAFDAKQHVEALEMRATPRVPDEAKKAFVELAEARRVATVTQSLLDRRILED